jgi:hypothetical protein
MFADRLSDVTIKSSPTDIFFADGYFFPDQHFFPTNYQIEMTFADQLCVSPP